MSPRQDAPSDGPIGVGVAETHHRPGPHQHDGHDGAAELPPGWSRAKPEHIPRPTYWPAVMALGITFLFWGVVTTFLISGVGVLLFAIALAGWIGGLRHGE